MCVSFARSSDDTPLSLAGSTGPSPDAWNRAMRSAATSPGGAAPEASMHLRPFHGLGLCDAVMTMPPAAPVAVTMTPTVGVVTFCVVALLQVLTNFS